MRKAPIGLGLIFLLFIYTSSATGQEATEYLLTWPPNPEQNVTGYIVYRSIDIHSPFEEVDTVDASTLTYIDSDVSAGFKYYYKIVAVGSEGETSPYSNMVSGLTIPQNASQNLRDLCSITSVDKIGDNDYDIKWRTNEETIGFIQYDHDYSDGELDSSETYIGPESIAHTIQLQDLISYETYSVRAIAYDDSLNMIISAIDTFTVNSEPTLPIDAPQLSIYPIPYNPGDGSLMLAELPVNGSVTIYNYNGLQVWHREVGGETTFSWDGSNRQGNKVMSGLYYVLIKNENGDVIEKRPIIIVR